MNCRQFRTRHAPYVDDLLSAAEMRVMRSHVMECDRCARIDVQVRRSLMVVRSLPPIQLSDDFLPRLNARLRDIRSTPLQLDPEPRWNLPDWIQRPSIAIAAGLALVTALGYGVMGSDGRPVPVAAAAVANTPTHQLDPVLIANAAAVAAVPTGMPMWSAVLAIGQLPTQFVDVGLTGDGGQ